MYTSVLVSKAFRMLLYFDSNGINQGVHSSSNEVFGNVIFQIHCNAAQSLCDIVRLGREQMMQMQDTSDPDPLLTTMEL